MTTLAHRSALRGPRNGGVAARRAIVRWAERMFRREWRQQLLVVTLLTVAVAAAIGSITITSNAVPVQYSDLGSATQRLTFDASDPRELQAGLDGARKSFGRLDVIGHRSVPVPGGVETVDYRSQVPGGAYSGELLALLEGSYPHGPGEVAVTDGVAELLRVDIGSTLALDGKRRAVVGIVENPLKLSEEFALVSPSSASPDHVDVFVGAGFESPAADAFYSALGDRNQSRWGFMGSQERGSDVSGAGEKLAMFSVATVFLLLASLVAAAGFAVVAQRRLRQLGMLAAIGATQKHLRLVLTSNGAVVGTIAAVIGTIAGLALWVAFAPTLESAVDHRIDRLRLPWDLIGLAVLLTVVGATVAAWWPGRAAARLPVVLALSGRPPMPRPARHSAVAAAALIVVGIACLALSSRDRAPLIVAGILATILGTLLLGPLAIRTLARTAGRAPVAARLALRDLARYQARSGAALAAITLALGIAAAVVVTAAAEEGEDADRMAAELPNLSDRQIRVYMGETQDPELIPLPLQTPAELAQSAARVRQLAAGLGEAAVTPLRKALQPGEPPIVTFDGDRAFFAAGLTRQVTSERWKRGSGIYVATPALLRYLGIDPATVDPSTNFLADPTVPTDQLGILNPHARKQSPITNVQRIESRQLLGSAGGDTGRVPDSFVTLSGLRRLGWKQVPAGWLVESGRPLTNEQIAAARDVAAEAGLTIETQRERTSLAAPMAIATAAGALLALAIIALTVGLIRSESAGDLRTLTATGATARIRRTLTAVTAGALALLGALLAVAGAYVLLGALYYDDVGHLSHPPVLYLILLVLGVPLAAAGAGWLVAGREPPAIARQVIE
jgi:putative ABC transport system permease protein